MNMSDPFIGQIIMFGGNFAPRGWAFCSGQLLSISSNQVLFSIIGTLYGGDGRTTFGLPDLRGRAALHAESSFTLGVKGGTPTTTLALNNMPAHDHDHQLRGSNALANASGPGGAVLLDVNSRVAYAQRVESVSFEPGLMDGFWSAAPYFGFRHTFKYDAEHVVLDKYTIVEPHRTRCVYNWLQYFSFESLSDDFERCGLRIVERFADLAGAPHQDGDMMTVVAQKL